MWTPFHGAGQLGQVPHQAVCKSCTVGGWTFSQKGFPERKFQWKSVPSDPEPVINLYHTESVNLVSGLRPFGGSDDKIVPSSRLQMKTLKHLWLSIVHDLPVNGGPGECGDLWRTLSNKWTQWTRSSFGVRKLSNRKQFLGKFMETRSDTRTVLVHRPFDEQCSQIVHKLRKWHSAVKHLALLICFGRNVVDWKASLLKECVETPTTVEPTNSMADRRWFVRQPTLPANQQNQLNCLRSPKISST